MSGYEGNFPTVTADPAYVPGILSYSDTGSPQLALLTKNWIPKSAVYVDAFCCNVRSRYTGRSNLIGQWLAGELEDWVAGSNIDREQYMDESETSVYSVRVQEVHKNLMIQNGITELTSCDVSLSVSL